MLLEADALRFSSPPANLACLLALHRFQRGLSRKHAHLIIKLRKAKKAAAGGEKPDPVRTHLRNMIIIPEMIGSIVGVYNGKTFNQVGLRQCPASLLMALSSYVDMTYQTGLARHGILVSTERAVHFEYVACWRPHQSTLLSGERRCAAAAAPFLSYSKLLLRCPARVCMFEDHRVLDVSSTLPWNFLWGNASWSSVRLH